MAKSTNIDEIGIVKFFEAGPIEKVEVVFNIVAVKVRERLRARDDGEPQERGPARKRRTVTVEAPRGELEAPSGS